LPVATSLTVLLPRSVSVFYSIFISSQATSEPWSDSEEYNSVETVATATASDIITRQLLVKV